MGQLSLSLAQSNVLLHIKDLIDPVVMASVHSRCKRANNQVLVVHAGKNALRHLCAGRESHGCLKSFADDMYALAGFIATCP